MDNCCTGLYGFRGYQLDHDMENEINNEMNNEMDHNMVNNNLPLEIERKFLIRYPDISVLEKLCVRKIAISQTYLNAQMYVTRRIRKTQTDGKTQYWYTHKEKITDVTRIEREREITEEEYLSLLKEARPDSQTINKVRYNIPSKDLCFEVDIFSEWDDRAFAEVELKEENQDFEFPECLELIKEVTYDSRYTNSSLARNGFVYDDIS